MNSKTIHNWTREYKIANNIKGVKLTCDVDAKTRAVFNPISLKKILINLLHNASKYTRKGEIKVSATDRKIIIEDTGIGIDKKY